MVKSKIALGLVFLLVLPSLVAAEKVIFMEFDIMKDGKVAMSWLSVVENTPDEPTEGSYALLVLDREGGEISRTTFSVSFFMSGTFESLNERTLIMKVPYREDAYAVQIQKNGATIFNYPIGSVCNNNFKCEGIENYASCPTDCISGIRDNYCDGVNDGRCDSDCAVSGDPDCESMPAGNTSNKTSVNYLLIASGFMIFLVAVVVIFLFFRRKPKVSKKTKFLRKGV